MLSRELRKLDRKYVWHPYTEINQHDQLDFPLIEKAQGIYLFEKDGKKLIDGIASWWCVNLGHSHPRLIEAIQKQTEKIQHVILGGLSHEPIIRLSEALARITPQGLVHSFFCSDGSSAVEASLKMAIQYWSIKGQKKKNRFISLTEGYHGDTLGAMGVGYIDKFHHRFDQAIVSAHRADSPRCAKCPQYSRDGECNLTCFSSMEKLIKKYHKECAAVIIEPLCQGAAGIRIYKDEYLKRLRKLCNEYNILLIADEIAVGFGRTGEYFACQRAGIVPDILVVGKGLTGGYLPMSAAVTTTEIFNTFRSAPGEDNTFYHGHTFGGNPIIAALALEALKVYQEEKIMEGLGEKEKVLKEGIQAAAEDFSHSFHASTGLIGMIEIAEAEGGVEKAKDISRKCRDLGLLIRPLGSVIYLWPPLISTIDEIRIMTSILKKAIQSV